MSPRIALRFLLLSLLGPRFLPRATCFLVVGWTWSAAGAPLAVPPELAGQVEEAGKQVERGDFAEAEKAYRRMLEAAPRNAFLLSNLGIVLFRERNYKAAEDAFTKAVAVNPDDGFSHCTLGIVHYDQGRYDEALASLSKALALNPQDATAHNYRGQILSIKGHPELAVKELETAVSLAPDYADAHFNLALVYTSTTPRDYESARKQYGLAVKLGADHDVVLERRIGWTPQDAAKRQEQTPTETVGRAEVPGK